MEILYLVGLVAFWLFKAYNQSKKKQKATEKKRAEEAREQRGYDSQEEVRPMNPKPKTKPQTLPSLEDILRELTGADEEEFKTEPEEIEPVSDAKPFWEEPVVETPYKAPVKIVETKESVKSESSKQNQLRQDNLLNQRKLKRNKKGKRSSSIQYFLRKEFNLKHAIVAQAILDAPYIKE